MNSLLAAWRREGGATFWRARRMEGFKKGIRQIHRGGATAD